MSKHIRFDWAMKRLLRNKANYVILEGFLSVLLKEDIHITEILESEGNKDSEHDKYNRIDILVKNSKEELVLIEVQNENENDYFHRMNYGQAKLTTEYLYEGDDYGKIKKIYSVNIVYFNLGQGDDYVYMGQTEFHGLHTHSLLQLNNAQKKIYPVNQVSDIFCTYYILKVNNFNDYAKDSLDEWIYFLKNSEIKNEFRAKGLAEARERLLRDQLSPSDKESYDQFIKNRRVNENVFETAILEGEMKAEKKYLPLIEEERKQKEEERKQKEEAKHREREAMFKLAARMKKYGEPISDIIRETGLSEGEIRDL